MHLVLLSLLAQYPGLTLPPSGNNQQATVIQHIGPVKVAIEYSSPAVKQRRGQIWGKLVPYGLTNLGFGNGNPGPWRAGANENTVFETSHPVTIDGKPLPAGRYGLHMIAGPDQWTVIFSKNAKAWGSYFYDEKEDALRVNVQPHKHEFREWLTYEFTTRKPAEATVELQWEDLAVGWTIAVPNANEIYLSNIRHELQSVPGFSWQGYVEAVNFCLAERINLEEALRWSDAAISMSGIGEKNFTTLTTKAQVLQALGRAEDSHKILLAALELPGTNALQIHQAGRQLLTAGKPKEALEVFELNHKRNGDIWPVHIGLARGYAATGDKKTALVHAKQALAQAPDEMNRKALADLVASLSSAN